MQDQPEDLASLAIAIRRANKAKRATKFARFKPLDYQREWFETDRPIRVYTLPNQSGKTTCGAITMLAACLGHKPVALGGNPPPRWELGLLAGKKFMCAGESYEKITTETIWPKLQEYVSEDMIKRITKNGKYISTVEFVTGAVLAFRSYDQHWRKFEGGNFDGVWFDEPPPQDVFSATRRGQMATEGWCIITGTPLPGSSWMRDELIFAEQNLDCEECSGGDKPHDEVVKAQPMHGQVFVPQSIEMHDNCLLAGSRVSGRFTGGLKADYSGPAVEIVTKHGERLRVTAQHPVLTDRGILRADLIDKGICLLREKPEQRLVGPGRYEQKQNSSNPTVEEVFDALSAYGRGVRKRSTLDLDGDERFFDGEEVRAVGLLAEPPDRRLMIDWRSHEIGNLALKLSDPAFGGVAHWKAFSTARDPRGTEKVLDRLPVVFDFPPPKTRCFGRIAEVDTALPQAALHSVLVASSFARELLDRFPGHVAFDEVVEVRHFHYSGHVYDFSTDVGYFASDSILVRNCRECHGGYLPHASIMAFLESISDESIRAARQHGIFVDSATLTFSYVNDRDNVVDDFDAPAGWPLVEVVDPSPKRGLHIKWYVCDPNDRWYNIAAERIPSDGGFRRMAQQVFMHRQKIGRHPDLALMDPRGGHHKQVGSDGIKDWFDQFRAHGITYVPAVAPSVDNARVQILHDWLKPVFDPSKGGEQVPRLRFCRRLRTMKKGPLWAYERFTWDPVLSPKKQYEQECKDFIDCDMYLALWVEKHNLTFRKYEDMDRPPMTGIAASYSSAPPVVGRGRPSPFRKPSLARGYASKHPEWVNRIKGSYS